MLDPTTPLDFTDSVLYENKFLGQLPRIHFFVISDAYIEEASLTNLELSRLNP